MPDRGATYTIVVDREKEIVSVTCNGRPMTKEGEPDVPPVGRNQRGVPNDIEPPHGYSGCICLGDLIEDNQGTCFFKWGKLF